MKTATIISYHVFGTKGTKAISINYRNKQLYHFMNNCYEADNVKKAVIWCKQQGFTHFKIVYN